MRTLKWVLPGAALLLSTACLSGQATKQAAAPAPTPSSSSALSSNDRSVGVRANRPHPLSTRQLQRHITQAGYPEGGVDGKEGPRTDQGLCAYRAVHGWAHQRQSATKADRLRLRHSQALPVPASTSSLPPQAKQMRRGVVVDQVCQVAFLIIHSQISRVIPISSGGHYQYYNHQTHQLEWADSPRGLFHLQRHRVPGIEVSKAVPDGQMWWPWYFDGGAALHGEADPGAVPTYPASHGCVRMYLKNIHFIWSHYHFGDPVLVYGRY